MTTSLIETTAGLTTTDLFQNDSAQGRVDKIRVEALAEVYDVTTAAGRKLCISQAGKVAKTKTAVDKLGKALSDSLNVERAKVMTDRRIYNDGLSELKIEVRQPVTDWEAAEVEKLAKVQQAFEHLVTNSEAHNITGELFSDVVLQAKLEKLEACDVADFGDQQEIAQERIFAGKTKIRAAIQQRKDADELAELRRLKQVEADKEAKRIADKEIADAAIERHEAAKVRIAGNKEQKERLIETGVGVFVKQGEPEAAKVDESMLRTPEDEAFQPKRTALAINTALIDDLVEFAGLTAGQARKVLAAISACEIRNLSINY